jgi:hypothetical protein
MAQQSSGEFVSANSTKGEEDARFQERGIRATIPLASAFENNSASIHSAPGDGI